MCLKIAVTEDLEVTVNRESVREYAERQRERYQKAGRTGKGRILDEVVAVTGYHRKSAVRLLSGRRRESRGGSAGRPVEYGLEVAAAARLVHEAAGGIGAKRLHPFVGALVGTRRAVLDKLYLSLNPLWLSHQIDAEIEKLEGWHGGKVTRYPGTLPITVILRSHVGCDDVESLGLAMPSPVEHPGDIEDALSRLVHPEHALHSRRPRFDIEPRAVLRPVLQLRHRVVYRPVRGI